jgi:threonine/homoserine/homoserine lactone efflux protein
LVIIFRHCAYSCYQPWSRSASFSHKQSHAWIHQINIFFFGYITGILIVSGAAVLGLGAVLQTSILLFATLKIIGAFYLIYLGFRQLNLRHNAFEKPVEIDKNSQQSHII